MLQVRNLKKVNCELQLFLLKLYYIIFIIYHKLMNFIVINDFRRFMNIRFMIAFDGISMLPTLN